MSLKDPQFRKVWQNTAAVIISLGTKFLEFPKNQSHVQAVLLYNNDHINDILLVLELCTPDMCPGY